MTNERFGKISVISLFVLLFLAYSFLAFKSPGKFTSPDETANFYFTKQFAKNLSFKVPEHLEKIAPIVAPRSIMVQKDGLAPGSFLGMPLFYGIIGWFLGKWIILFLTPLFSAIAVFVFYKLIILIFDRRTALISAGLMAIHPAFWYYTARGMFHNALFLNLLIFGFYFLARIIISHNTNSIKYQVSSIKYYGDYALAGLFIGIAVAVRTSEVIWIAVLLLAVVIIFRKLIDWRIGIWIALIGMIISMIPIFHQNHKLYGSALIFSYTVATVAEKTEVAAKTADKAAAGANVIAKTFDSIAGLFEKAIFPFGIHWDNIFANVWNYGIWLVWPFALLTLFGIIFFIKKAFFEIFAKSKLEDSKLGFENYLEIKNWKLKIFKKSKFYINAKFIYLMIYIFLASYLILYYGSWNITDNILGKDAVSLEQSYARYWLPLYIFGLPFAAYLLDVIFKKSSARFRAAPRGWLILAGAFLILNFSVSSVLLERSVGLAKIRENTVEYKEVALKAKRTIESSAVIVSGKADKIFFPEFKVIASEIDTNKKARQLKKILQKAPVYISILDFAGQSEKLNKLESYGFKIGEEIKVGKNVKLYRLMMNK